VLLYQLNRLLYRGKLRRQLRCRRAVFVGTPTPAQQVQRRAVSNPSVNFTRKRTVPQWHAASISAALSACIVKLPAEGSKMTRYSITLSARLRAE
jgi:hypothetical protein